ncbi:hypothetical protein NK326_24500, partial [Salmonella enterica]|nr:hypothetical protein [Salmonella enterica]
MFRTIVSLSALVAALMGGIGIAHAQTRSTDPAVEAAEGVTRGYGTQRARTAPAASYSTNMSTMSMQGGIAAPGAGGVQGAAM